MRNTTPLTAMVVVAGMAVGSAACTGTSNPVTPTAVQAADSQQGGALVTQDGALVRTGITGIIRDLNKRRRIFTVEGRDGSRLVRADSQTTVWDSGTRVRFGALHDGLRVGVRGTDEGRYILARSIGISR